MSIAPYVKPSIRAPFWKAPRFYFKFRQYPSLYKLVSVVLALALYERVLLPLGSWRIPRSKCLTQPPAPRQGRHALITVYWAGSVRGRETCH